MEHQLSHAFYLRKSKKTRDKLCPIYLRITINGQRLDDSVRRYINPSNWIKGAGRLKKNTEEAREINLYLDSITAKIQRIEREMVLDGKPITFNDFRNAWEGLSGKNRMLLDVFEDHNKKMEALVTKGEVAPGTLQRYKTTREHTQQFLKDKYKIEDIPLFALNYEFASNFEFWLKTVRNCDHNTAMKYIANLKKIINICLRTGWLSKDPFFGFKRTKHEVVKEPLTAEELDIVERKYFSTDRLSQVRDIFLFCCFTGLAYADIKKLKRSEITKSQDGKFSITTYRQKTKGKSVIPLLAMAVQLLDKYADHPDCIRKGVAFPVLSNQKMNSYLKEIADLCGIQKVLTFHIARHTFATTVALENGIPIETLSKMLAHKRLATTQEYGKITARKIKSDMYKLEEKIEFIGNRSLSERVTTAAHLPSTKIFSSAREKAKDELIHQLTQLKFAEPDQVVASWAYGSQGWEPRITHRDPGVDGVYYLIFIKQNVEQVEIERIEATFDNSYIRVARSWNNQNGPLPTYPQMEMELNIEMHVLLARQWLSTYPAIEENLRELGFDKDIDQITLYEDSKEKPTILIIGPAIHADRRRLGFFIGVQFANDQALIRSVSAVFMKETEYEGRLLLGEPTASRDFSSVNGKFPSRDEMAKNMLEANREMQNPKWIPPPFLSKSKTVE